MMMSDMSMVSLWKKVFDCYSSLTYCAYKMTNLSTVFLCVSVLCQLESAMIMNNWHPWSFSSQLNIALHILPVYRGVLLLFSRLSLCVQWWVMFLYMTLSNLNGHMGMNWIWGYDKNKHRTKPGIATFSLHMRLQVVRWRRED